MSTEVLTTHEAAALLSMHPKTLLRQAREGRVPAARIGGRWKFSRRQLMRWLEAAAGRGARDTESVVVEGETFLVRVERDEGGWSGYVDELPGCDATGRTRPAMLLSMAEVIYECQFADEPDVDAALVAEVERRQADPENQRTIPWAEVKAALGL